MSESFQLLTDDFLAQFPDQPEHQTPISQFVYLRTYSRYLPKKKRRETWKEICTRAVTYNISLGYNQYLKNGYRNSLDLILRLRNEAEALFMNKFNLDQFLSGRTTYVGGAETSVADLYPLSNYNCSFTNIETLYDLCSLFYLLLIGTGVGFKCTPAMARKLEPIRLDMEIVNDPYETVYPIIKEDNSSLVINGDKATIYVGDSKEGWVIAQQLFIDVMTKEEYTHVKRLHMNYNYVRPIGSKLKRFGGTASGPNPLMELYGGIGQMLRNEEDVYLKPIEVVKFRPTGEHIATFGQLRPIHILSWGNRIGYGVVVGGVRRTAEIFGIGDDPELDWETVFAKYGINGFDKEKHFENHAKVEKMLIEMGVERPGWWDSLHIKMWKVEKNFIPTYFHSEEEAREHAAFLGDGAKIIYPANPGREGLWHRSMSNNSVGFTKKPDRDVLKLLFQMMQGEGEPGFVNLRELAIRRFHAMGIHDYTESEMQGMMQDIFMNPCAEIDLSSKGVCNLTTINVTGFVYEEDGTYKLDIERLKEAQRLSVRAGTRMTLVDLESMPWETDPESWDKVQKRDRLIGCSLTGFDDAMELLGYDREQRRTLLATLSNEAHVEAVRYASELRIPVPLLDTTVKPEGTLSLVAVNRHTKSPVSSGLHKSHAPDYIRRIRITAKDALAKTAAEQGWRMFPENGTPGATHEERMANASTYVIEFPVHSGAKRTKEDSTVEEQFDTYFDFQEFYTAHNSSNTIDIKDETEWDKAEKIVWENWDRFTAVSFLAADGGTYKLPPLEAITEDECGVRLAEMAPLDLELLASFETGVEVEDDSLNDPSCSNGVCGVR